VTRVTTWALAVGPLCCMLYEQSLTYFLLAAKGHW